MIETSIYVYIYMYMHIAHVQKHVHVYIYVLSTGVPVLLRHLACSVLCRICDLSPCHLSHLSSSVAEHSV